MDPMYHMAMKREMRDRLTRAKKLTIKGERSIANLGAHIEQMKQQGHDAKRAERMLDQFKQIQAAHADGETIIVKEMDTLRH